MGDRSVRAGETIKLRALFKDDLGDIAQASDVVVSIWDPNGNTSDINTALVVSGVATDLGQGIWEYSYPVPISGPGGTWTDRWHGTLLTQDIEADFTFFVSADTIITSIDCQLFDNNLVQVTIPSGLQATDGTTLTEQFEFEFMTTTNPSYTNLRKVRLDIGGFIGSLPDDTIQTAILEASLEADVITFATPNLSSKVFLHARREYTTCLAGSIILSNLGNLRLKSKTLADLRVDYDTSGATDMLNRLRECMDKWMPQIISGGNAIGAGQPKMVVKGSLDPDRPFIGRTWESTDTIGRQGVPAANIKIRELNHRRAKRTYWPRHGGRW